MSNPESFYTRKVTAALVGYHPVHLRRLPNFPDFIRIGPKPNGRVLYVKSEVDQWIADRIAERDAVAEVEVEGDVGLATAEDHDDETLDAGADDDGEEEDEEEEIAS